MADHTQIEWTDATWNPITGCSVVSSGCTNCYAMKLAGTRLKHDPSRQGLTTVSKAGPVWTGEVRLNTDWLTQPLRWKKPRRIFVCAHGDLFHENVPDAWIDQVFAVMALSPQHTFQVLTKRPERMREYLTGPNTPRRIARLILDWFIDGQCSPSEPWPVVSVGPIDDPYDITLNWPLPNVWLGVSVEDQARADQRIPILLNTPAAVRWISAEPLLGPIDLSEIDINGEDTINALSAQTWQQLFDDWPEDDTVDCTRLESFLDWYDRSDLPEGPAHKVLDWVVVGGESGPDARPMHPDWARQLRDQCAAAGVPFFFKQWGEWAVSDANTHWLGVNGNLRPVGQGVWASDIPISRVGKKRAGNRLDGQRHQAWPDDAKGGEA